MLTSQFMLATADANHAPDLLISTCTGNTGIESMR
jgi:hypothetical protein